MMFKPDIFENWLEMSVVVCNEEMFHKLGMYISYELWNYHVYVFLYQLWLQIPWYFLEDLISELYLVPFIRTFWYNQYPMILLLRVDTETSFL